MSNRPYRIYKAQFPFEARDETEVSIAEDHTLVVYQKDDGSWPAPEGWLRGESATQKLTFCASFSSVIGKGEGILCISLETGAVAFASSVW